MIFEKNSDLKRLETKFKFFFLVSFNMILYGTNQMHKQRTGFIIVLLISNDFLRDLVNPKLKPILSKILSDPWISRLPLFFFSLSLNLRNKSKCVCVFF